MAGVDLNPFAAAIARFRLCIAALRASEVRRLADAPAFELHVAAGDSLLHGPRPGLAGARQEYLEGVATDPLGHVYRTEDAEALRAILGRRYHVVVGNPPYITPKDKALNLGYRERFGSCHRKYSLAVPFTERFFDLAHAPASDATERAGFVGMITANSFMKREFGRKLIEEFIPRWDLTHVVDTSGAYIPGHGTPTVILFGRHRGPVERNVRAVMGIRGEPAIPDDPANGLVWSAIVAQVEQPGSQSEFVSASDVLRQRFHKHPWSIGGGGAAELQQRIVQMAQATLGDMITAIGRRVRLFFVEEFLPYSWAFLPADASLQCSFRGDSNQASAYPRLSGGQPSLETVPNTVGLSPSGALPSGHSRGVLVRFHGQGDRPVMAVTTGFQGRRFDVPEARTGVPRIDLPSPAPCAAADAVFADAKAFLSSNEARQMSESELERELHRRGQKLVRKLLQGHHDQRSPGQAAGPAEDASGVECSARREQDSHAETTSGTMQVVGLGCARRGHDGLHPLDAALNLLPERSLVDMRRRVTIATASRAPPRTPWKPQWYSTLSTWQRRCGVRCSSPAP